MAHWGLKQFVQPNGTRPVEKWVTKELSVREQATLDSLLTILERTKTWGMPDFRPLQGGHGNLREIRWKGDQKRPLRLVGFFGLNSGEFTLLIGCTHDGNKYDPANALDTALKRMCDLKNGIGESCEYES